VTWQPIAAVHYLEVYHSFSGEVVVRDVTKHLASLGLLLAYLLLALGSSDRRTPEQKAQEQCEDKTTAFVMSQSFVKKRLRAPATADFPWSGDSEVSIKYLGDCTHEVRAYVDAQNAFGAKIRSRYYVKLQNRKGTDTWTALDVQIYGH
jgi:hypothetical protein